MLKHVLVTLDGSELAEAALDYARSIVCEAGHVTILSVIDVPEVAVYNFYPVPVAMQEPNQETMLNDMKEQATEYLKQVKKRLEKAGLTVNYHIEMGEPAAAIVEKAEALRVDAIIMSTHGRSGISRWLFGSVTQKVLSGMPCPVFVVPGARHPSAAKEAEQTEQQSG